MTYIFFREGGWYPVDCKDDAEARDVSPLVTHSRERVLSGVSAIAAGGPVV